MKNWLSQNKLKLLLIATAVLVGYWFGQRQPPTPPLLRAPTFTSTVGSTVGSPVSNIGERAALKEDYIEPTNVEDGGSPSERLVIKTGDLSLLVKDVRVSVDEMQKLAVDFGGFVVDSQITIVDEKKQNLRAAVTIRVPAEKFDETLKILEDAAVRVTGERTSGQDVTEEYTDLQSRLRNLEATEAQLLKIMERAGEIKDVLAVQQELTRVREQIETVKGRIKFLEESAALSAITAHFATEEEELPIVEEGWRPLATVKSALRALVSFGQAIADKIIFALVFLSPVIVVGLLIWFLRGRRKK